MKLDLSGLNNEQHHAVKTTEGPLLVLAGAGSGKTRVITSRIAHLALNKKVPPGAILAVTFTNKAAREMSARVMKMVPSGKNSGKERPLMCTFHSLGVRLLRAHITLLGYRANFTIYDDSDQQAVVKTLMEDDEFELGLDTPKEAHFALQFAKRTGRTPEEMQAPQGPPRDIELGRLLGEYQRMLKRMGAIDFEDILLLSLQLCREHPEPSRAFFGQFRYVMVDEYQDTNRIQYELLRHMVAGHGNLCVVGDDDQSIYGWRGAAPGNILDFEQDFPGAQVVRLEENYRSTSTILAAANQVIRNNGSRKEKTLRTRLGAGSGLEWIAAADESDELERVVNHLKLTRMREGATWSDIAVLYRSNHQSRAVEELLREEGIPYELVGGTRFYERAEVRNAVGYLRVIQQPEDEIALLRVLNFPRRGIGKISQGKLLDYAAHQHRPAFQVLAEAGHHADFSGAVGTAMERFAEMITRYQRRFATEPMGNVFRELMAEVSMHKAVENERDGPKGAEKASALIYELEFAIDQFAHRHEDAGIREFLEYVTLLTLPEKSEEGASTPQVHLMTVHSAKGLEFPFVYLINLAEEIFPNKRALAEGAVEEERRLFYVAITRARRQLVFSMGRERKRWGQVVRQRPSRFLGEIDSELFDGPAPSSDAAANAVLRKEKAQNARSRFFDQVLQRDDAAGS